MHMKTKTIGENGMLRKNNAVFVVLIIVALILSGCSTNANSSAGTSGSVSINGAGSTFAQPVYSQWIYSYKTVDPSVSLNYQGIGSGGGKNGIINNTLDFAGSDLGLATR